MVEIIPVMLFILGWHPDRPGDLQFTREQIVFVSQQDCEEEGARRALRMTEAESGERGFRYEHRCVPIPAMEEFDAAYEKLAPPRP